MKLIAYYIAALLLGLLAYHLGNRFTPRDDTDPPGGRSGLGVFVDHRTGCQYLSRPFGGVTPRLGPDRQHLGCKP